MINLQFKKKFIKKVYSKLNGQFLDNIFPLNIEEIYKGEAVDRIYRQLNENETFIKPKVLTDSFQTQSFDEEKQEFVVNDNLDVKKQVELQKLKSQVLSIRNRFLDDGVEYKNNTFWCDKESNKDLFTFGISILSNDGSVPLWKGKDGYLINPTLEQLQTLFTMCMNKLSEAYIREKNCYDYLDTLDSFDDVDIASIFNAQ